MYPLVKIFTLQSVKDSGFTLSEVLISLLILGLIATFTIPKVLIAQQMSEDNSKVLEAASLMAQAHSQHKNKGLLTANTTLGDLTQYLNFAKEETASYQLDGVVGTTQHVCVAGQRCYLLHSGAMIHLIHWCAFGGTNATNAIQFIVDPNGVRDTATAGDAPGKAVGFFLYQNGFLTSRDNVKTGTTTVCDGAYSPNGGTEPSWFHWPSD